MTQGCVNAFARTARSLVLAALISGLGAGTVLAQSVSGKLEGTVRDQTGAPIANAQVFIVGTTFNVTTNADGYYFMNKCARRYGHGAGQLHRLQSDPDRGAQDPE